MNPDIQQLLEVPYSEKEQAKKLGARWEPELKKWYVPNGVALESLVGAAGFETPGVTRSK